MFHRLSSKIFWIILSILSFVLLSILVFIIYIIPNLYYDYSMNQSKQYVNEVITCYSDNTDCTEELSFTADHFFYIINNSNGDITFFEYINDTVTTITYAAGDNFAHPDGTGIGDQITTDDGEEYTIWVEVKTIDTSFFKKFAVPLFFAVIIISAITSYFISRLFTRPIETINKQIKELENLNFNTTLYVNTKDELGEISNSLVKLNDVISLGISSIEGKKKNSDDFLKIMSHELKTPLTVVRGYNELLTMDDSLTQKQANYLDISIEEIDKMTQIINNSIISSKLDSMQKELYFKVIKLNDLVENEISTYNTIYPDVKVSYDINDYEYNTNPDILKLAIKNIIENAFLHHTNDTEIKVVLKDNYLEVTNYTTNKFDTTTIRNKDNKNLGVYITITSLQLLDLKYELTLVDNLVTFKILL